MLKEVKMINDLEIELVNICNLKCPLCIRSSATYKQGEKRFLDEKIIYDIISKNSPKTIVFAGSISEPTLHPNFFNIIKFITFNFDARITIYTNGTASAELYRKLSILLGSKTIKHKIIFTICGATQEMHTRYRVGSKLADVINAYNICSKNMYAEINWLIFNYNINDYLENRNFLKGKIHRVFHTIAYNELLKGEYDTDIGLIGNLASKLSAIDKKWDGNCPALTNKFRSLSFDGKLYFCNMKRFYGEKFCYMCSKKNLDILLKNGITPPPEPSGEVFIYDSPGVMK